MHITQVMHEVHVHVLTCARAYLPLFRLSGMATRVTIKFDAWSNAHELSVCVSLRWGTAARVHLRTPFPHLENDWTDCAELKYLFSGNLAFSFYTFITGANCTCAKWHSGVFQYRGRE